MDLVNEILNCSSPGDYCEEEGNGMVEEKGVVEDTGKLRDGKDREDKSSKSSSKHRRSDRRRRSRSRERDMYRRSSHSRSRSRSRSRDGGSRRKSSRSRRDRSEPRRERGDDRGSEDRRARRRRSTSRSPGNSNRRRSSSRSRDNSNAESKGVESTDAADPPPAVPLTAKERLAAMDGEEREALEAEVRKKKREREEHERRVKQAGVRKYFCTMCKEGILDIAGGRSLSEFPRRSTGDIVVQESKCVRGLKAKKGKTVDIKRPKGVERQFRLDCANCGVFTCYRPKAVTSSIDIRTVLYVLPGALVDASGALAEGQGANGSKGATSGPAASQPVAR